MSLSSLPVIERREFCPEVLDGRLVGGESSHDFVARLAETQSIPCSWGNMRDRNIDELKALFARLFHFPKESFPLSLHLGCGEGMGGRPVYAVCPFGRSRIKLFSDYCPVDGRLVTQENYVQIDLTKPEQIDLGGLRCHWISATMLFTDDAVFTRNSFFGVVWPSEEVLKEALEAIFGLMMPQGLLYIDHGSSGFSFDVGAFATSKGLDVFQVGRNEILLQLNP